jgi:4-alpha-glucanotransferase
LDHLREQAERHGIQQEFWDIFGQQHLTSDATNLAILSALGAGTVDSVELLDSRPFPETLVIGRSDQLPAVCLVAPDFALALETGEVLTASQIPETLPFGYHEVRALGIRMRLIVGPDAAVLPPDLRRAGLGVTLYGLRSSRNWGVGDFRDLRDLIDWAVPALHANFIALNPLHAIQNRTPFNASPYLPNSIYYRNFLYLDVEAVPGYAGIRAAFETPGTLAELAELRATETVQYERVAALKRRALELIFEANPPDAACRNWVHAEGDLLRLFATYCALDEHLHAADPDVWNWPQWPVAFQDPASPAVAQFAETHDREIFFHFWLQWLVDRQVASVQAHARQAGMGIGLYHDLALATDRCGSDLWAHRPFFVHGARVGSPPDDFSPSGQDWSFPPPNQQRHFEDGYRLYTESIRKSMRHGGALRIDHVMRLFRLYWIPEGHTAADGAYVRDRAADLVRILALESIRNNAVIIGEDLGTVEPEVRETLARFGILSYRLLIFEQDANGFKRPADYPVQALTSTTTHDLPTITGFWTGEDIEARLRVGVTDDESHRTQKESRVRDRQRLLDALLAEGLLSQDHERDAAMVEAMTPEIRVAILGYLAKSRSALWLVNQEDLTAEPLQQNMPGTTAEYPNWSRKMRWSLEELGILPEALEAAAQVRGLVEESGRSRSSQT